MSIIAFIPARGGSKSIPLKNIKPLHGQPLIYWTTKACSECSLIDKVVVATDDDQISNTVSELKFPKVSIYDRQPDNAQDGSSTESVMLEYIKSSKLSSDDLFILVQATSPFTKSEHLLAAIEKYKSSDIESLLSVTRTKRFFWDENGSPMNYDFQARPRRQDFEGLLMENGAFYINSVTAITKNNNRLSGKIGYYEMPEYCGLELDEPDDWVIAEQLMKKYRYT